MNCYQWETFLWNTYKGAYGITSDHRFSPIEASWGIALEHLTLSLFNHSATDPSFSPYNFSLSLICLISPLPLCNSTVSLFPFSFYLINICKFIIARLHFFFYFCFHHISPSFSLLLSYYHNILFPLAFLHSTTFYTFSHQSLSILLSSNCFITNIMFLLSLSPTTLTTFLAS